MNATLSLLHLPLFSTHDASVSVCNNMYHSTLENNKNMAAAEMVQRYTSSICQVSSKISSVLPNTRILESTTDFQQYQQTETKEATCSQRVQIQSTSHVSPVRIFTLTKGRRIVPRPGQKHSCLRDQGFPLVFKKTYTTCLMEQSLLSLHDLSNKNFPAFSLGTLSERVCFYPPRYPNFGMDNQYLWLLTS